jgi:non-ribosomal peptide synthetase component F
VTPSGRICVDRHPRESGLAAHCLTPRLFSDTGDITTGLVTGGRPEEADAERITGLFLETLPLRLDTRPRTRMDSAREVYQQQRDSHPHRHYSLSAIQENRGGDVIFETAFNYVNPHVLTSFFEVGDGSVAGMAATTGIRPRLNGANHCARWSTRNSLTVPTE